MAADDVIGKISFQAPDEGTGTDAVLVSGAIQAVAEGDHSSSSNATRLEFMTGASEAATAKMKLSSGGDLTVTAGNVVMGTSGKGIDFSATADSGGTMSSELFDDYEEGTFTPTISPSSGSFTTEGTHTGFYTKVGNLVNFSIGIDITTNGSASGHINITGGAPFTSAATGIIHTVNHGRETEINGGSFVAILGRNDTTIGLLSPPFGNGAGYSVNGTYRAA